jgi:hypothetical protein
MPLQHIIHISGVNELMQRSMVLIALVATIAAQLPLAGTAFAAHATPGALLLLLHLLAFPAVGVHTLLLHCNRMSEVPVISYI